MHWKDAEWEIHSDGASKIKKNEITDAWVEEYDGKVDIEQQEPRNVEEREGGRGDFERERLLRENQRLCQFVCACSALIHFLHIMVDFAASIPFTH